MLKSSSLLAIALNFAILGSLFAQTPTPRPTLPAAPSAPTDDDVVRVTTDLVQIDAVVTDQDGKPVTDLRAEDFEIFEDKKPQQITAFSYVSTDTGAIASSAPPSVAAKNAPPVRPDPLRPDQVRRTLVFVVDDLGLSFSSFSAVRSGLKKFVDERMQPGDLVAIVRTGEGSGALQRLTSDKAQLYAAIEKAHWTAHLNRVGVRLFRSEGTLAPSLNGTMLALDNVVASLQVMPGRKTVLFFTDSFEVFNNPRDPSSGSSDVPSAGTLSSAGETNETNQTNATSNDGFDFPSRLKKLVQLSNQASVVFYTVDARGLAYTGPMASDGLKETRAFTGKAIDDIREGNLLDLRSETLLRTQRDLQVLASETGGFGIMNNNDLGQGIERITEDLKGYYLVGYRPAAATFEKQNGRPRFHNIRLSLKRPGLHVRSRKGFYGVPDEKLQPPAPRTIPEQLVAALESPFVAGGVGVRLTALFANTPQGSVVRTFLHVDARDLSFKEQPDGWHQAEIAVLASSYGENGLLADYLSRTEIIRARGRTYANLLRYGLNYSLLVPIKKSGPYQLRAAVRDTASDRTGSAYQFIEVPELKKQQLALSGLLVSSTMLDVSTLSATGSVYNSPVDGEAQAQPTAAVRRFQRRMLLEYHYVIYNARAGKNDAVPELIAQVRVFRDGQLLITHEEPAIDSSKLQLDPKRLSASGRLRLGDELEPGQYVLQVIVTDPHVKARGATASQWIDFELVK